MLSMLAALTLGSALAAEAPTSEPSPNLPVAALQPPMRTGEIAEFAITQGLITGTTLGVLVPFSIQDYWSSSDVPLALFVGGGVLGAGAAIAATQTWPITVGQGMSFTNGELIGGLNGFVLAGVLQPQDLRMGAAITLAGTITGGAMGVLYGKMADPTPGQAALVRSSLVWGSALTGLTFALADPYDVSQTYLRLGAGGNLGVLLGLALAPRFSGSRLGINIMNAGGVLGLIASGVISAGLSGADIYDESTHGAMALVVTGVGLASGAALGRWFDQNRASSLQSRRRIQWTTPVPLVSHQPDGSWQVQLRLDGVRF